MANPEWKKGMKTPNPAGRKGGKQKDIVPPEFRRILNKLKKIVPEAVDILEQRMAYEIEDEEGNVQQILDVKIAEKLIQIYFQAHKLNEDLKNKAEKKGLDTDDEEGDNDSSEQKNPMVQFTIVKPENK